MKVLPLFAMEDKRITSEYTFGVRLIEKKSESTENCNVTLVKNI